MNTADAHFSVDTRLTRLLGETYRSSEAALKELVDNAWDAEAANVWVTLPGPMSASDLIVRDDGAGMTALEMRTQYLNIASDKRRRTGDRTPVLNRKIKGRKGIGKFAGLVIAGSMRVTSVARGVECELLIDKLSLLDNEDDLEAVSLPFSEGPAAEGSVGTIITLSDLDDRLNFPVPERLREILVHEYGRETGFAVYVNGTPLSVEDVPGPNTKVTADLPLAGAVDLRFTIADGKRLPRSPGIVLKVDGKTVGRPMTFGLEEDEEVPASLLRRVYGEVELTGLDDFVTADWGGVMENSKAFQETRAHVVTEVKARLRETHTRDMSLQKARLQQRLNRRLERLPEHRRRFAEDALGRILKRFYGETDDRVATIAEVALDAMEHDAYWAVLERIGAASNGDVDVFARSLEEFGLLELGAIAAQAAHRRAFLDLFEKLLENPKTLEKEVHTAFESNLWMLGRRYSAMASNISTKRIVETYCFTKFKGARAAKRPDLLLSEDSGGGLLLIEFKRPQHSISRDDIAQAEKYRDDLGTLLSSSARMEILMLGKGRAVTIDTKNLSPAVTINSYAGVVATARGEMEWLVRSMSNPY